MRTVLKYIFFQLPSLLLLTLILLLLREWIELSWLLFWVLLGSWILKDVVLYPLVWRSYAPYDGVHPMLGLEGEARERIDPEGYVKVRGELWQAELRPGELPIDPGVSVRVVGQRGLKLIVETPKERSGTGRDQVGQ